MLVNNICQDDQIPNPTPNFLINQTHVNDFSVTVRGMADHELPRPPVIHRRENHVILLFFPSFILSRISLTIRGHKCFLTLFFFWEANVSHFANILLKNEDPFII
jgi:hypothetical protein